MSKNIFKKAPLVVTEAEQKRMDLEATLALAGAGDNPVFKAVLNFADAHARNEHEAALRPDLVNDVRQFNCGRSSSAYDFAHALRELAIKADAEAKKLKAE